MKDYIQQTIQDLEGRISGLTLALNALKTLDSPEAAPTVAPAARAVQVHHHKRAPSDIMRAGQDLADEFDSLALAKLLGSKPAAHRTAHHWKQQGWIKRIGYGRYAKTPTFPKPTVTEINRRLLDQIHAEEAAKQPKS